MDNRGMSKGMTVFWIALVVGIVAVLGTLYGTGNLGTLSVGPINVSTTTTGNGVQAPGPSGSTAGYQPTATYAAVDKFSTSPITGTSYYKADGQKATTTALTNVNPGVSYTYWVDNGSGKNFVKPATFTATDGSNNIVATGYQYAAPTITAYDNNAGVAIGSATHNVTLTANGQANIDLKYQGTAKKSGAPFGGVMVIEYNSSISSVTASSPYIMSSNPYTLVYSVTNTGDTYKTYAFNSQLDDGSGNLNHITLQFQNGNAAMPTNGSLTTVDFYPANYYVTNSGNIVLDTSKAANSDTARTTTAGPYKYTFYFVK